MADPTSQSPFSRRRLFTYTAALASAATFTGSLSACGSDDAGSGSGGNADSIAATFSTALTGGFDPLTASSRIPLSANMHTLEGLLDLDPVTREPYLALAREMPTKVDALTYRAQLRDGATFQDGSPVTAEDVVFSTQRLIGPKSTAVIAPFLKFIKSAKAVDETTVEFRLAYAFSLVVERLGLIKVLPRKIVEADPKKFDALPTGSGPFQLTAADPNTGLTFVSFEGYNGPRPARVKNMTWNALPDPSARTTALTTGRVQVIQDIPPLNVEQVSKSATVSSEQGFAQLFLMFNCSIKPFDDVRVRQALRYAIDTEELVTTALAGTAIIPTSYLPPNHPDYYQAKTQYTYDPEKSKSLLADAGVTNLDIELLAPIDDFAKSSVPIIKQGWDAVGVNTTLQIAESGGLYANYIDTGKYQAMAGSGDPSVFGSDLDLLMRWFFDGTWPKTRSYSAEDPASAKVIELLDQAIAATDEARRDTIWHEALDLVADQAWTYPIFQRKLSYGVDETKLDGFRPLPFLGLSLLDVGRK